MSELKPCPFCGKEAVHRHAVINGMVCQKIGWIGCLPCRVHIDYVNGKYDVAAATWNQRAEVEQNASDD